jgi:hypothetical protein
MIRGSPTVILVWTEAEADGTALDERGSDEVGMAAGPEAASALEDGVPVIERP